MQYPQIQFYRGSLVRLPSGRLKQVEELSSDDFLDNALLYEAQQEQEQQQPKQTSNNMPTSLLANRQTSKLAKRSKHLSDPNNNSLFNFHSSPGAMLMETEELEEEEEEDDYDEEDEELDVVTADQPSSGPADVHRFCGTNSSASNPKRTSPKQQQQLASESDICIGLSVVKDFLEVSNLPTSVSPASSTGSHSLNSDQHAGYLDLSCNSSKSNGHPLCQAPSSPPITFNQTVLIKFALGVNSGSRNIVFNEVPIDQPFFVFQRGWSSWNPQRTYDKFGLKCRKLKIGDTCISLFRKQRNAHPNSPHQLSLSPQLQTGFGGGGINKRQQDSDQCNILFSTIKLV